MRMRCAVFRRLEDVRAAAGAGRFGDLAINRTDSFRRFGRDRDEVARTQLLGTSGVEWHVVRGARRALDDGKIGALEFIREALTRYATGDGRLRLLRVKRLAR